MYSNKIKFAHDDDDGGTGIGLFLSGGVWCMYKGAASQASSSVSLGYPQKTVKKQPEALYVVYVAGPC